MPAAHPDPHEADDDDDGGGPPLLLARYQDSGQWSRALQVAEDLSQADAANPLWRRSAGQAALHLDRLEEARAHLEEALRLDPEDDLAHYYAGHLWRLRGDPDLAERAIARAIELDPRDADYWTELGWLCFERRDFRAARRCATRARALDPGCARAATLSAAADSQLPCGTRDDPRAQVRALEEALELDPVNDAALHNIGVVYFNALGDFRRAEAYFRRALAIDPNENLYRRNLVRAIRRQDRVLKVLHAPWRAVMATIDWLVRCWNGGRLRWIALPTAPPLLLGCAIVLIAWAVFLWPPAAFYEYLTLAELRGATGEVRPRGTGNRIAPHHWPRTARFALFLAGFSAFLMVLVGAWKLLAYRWALAWLLGGLLTVCLIVCLYAYAREFIEWRARRRRSAQIDSIDR